MKSIDVAILATGLAASARQLGAQGEAMFRGDLSHTGAYAGAGVTRAPRVKWVFHTKGRVIATPTVANGTVYFGSTDGNVYAVDGESGRQRWAFATEARVASSPAVADGLVYVESYDGALYALDARSGKQAWKFATAGERRFAGKYLHGHLPRGETMPDPFDLYLSSPAVWRGAVYFGSGDGNVYALDAKSGRPKWTFRTGNVVHASPAIANGTLFIGSWDSWFYALDATTGKEKWRFKTGEDTVISNQVGIQSSAAVMDGVVFFGCRDGHLYAVDAASGKQRWAFDMNGSWVNTSPAVRSGKVYVGTADSRTLYELDARTGKANFSLEFSWYFLRVADGRGRHGVRGELGWPTLRGRPRDAEGRVGVPDGFVASESREAHEVRWVHELPHGGARGRVLRWARRRDRPDLRDGLIPVVTRHRGQCALHREHGRESLRTSMSAHSILQSRRRLPADRHRG